MGRRPQNKRRQQRIYEYLQENGECTAEEVAYWYSKDREAKTKAVRGYNYGVTTREIAGIMAKCILFERSKVPMRNTNCHTWSARPLNDVVDKAIKSNSPLKKYPMFLQTAIKERLDE